LVERREGIAGPARFKFYSNWLLLGAALYDLRAEKFTQTQIGVGYVDDCLILALNYITEYAYNSTQTFNHSIMMQLTLRTIGGSAVSTNTTALGQGIGLSR